MYIKTYIYIYTSSSFRSQVFPPDPNPGTTLVIEIPANALAWPGATTQKSSQNIIWTNVLGGRERKCGIQDEERAHLSRVESNHSVSYKGIS